VEKSISRVMNAVAPREHLEGARRARQWLSKFNRARDLIQLGAYVPGADPELDAAVRVNPQLMTLLQQDMHDGASLIASSQQLLRLNPSA